MYYSLYIISLGKPGNDDVSPVLYGWREATTGDTVCLLSQGTPWAFVYDFFLLSTRRTQQCLFPWYPSSYREFSTCPKEKSPEAASFSHLFTG